MTAPWKRLIARALIGLCALGIWGSAIGARPAHAQLVKAPMDAGDATKGARDAVSPDAGPPQAPSQATASAPSFSVPVTDAGASGNAAADAAAPSARHASSSGTGQDDGAGLRAECLSRRHGRRCAVRVHGHRTIGTFTVHGNGEDRARSLNPL